MSTRVDPGLMKDLKAFGLRDAGKCFHCSNCTVTCPLSTPENPFPRKLIRYMQLGLKDRILQAPEPWLCYYCGDCSSQCPRGAEPGETMMVARRYLTSLYDWTGFSRRFYTSGKFEVSAIALVALLVGLGLLLFNTGKPNWQHADLNSVWPSHSVELADLGLAAVLLFLLLGNVFRCIKAVMGDFAFKVPLRVYAGQLKEFIVHALTQKRFGQCSDKMQWVAHLMTMTGYATAFLLVVVLLNGLTVEGLSPARLAGISDFPSHPAAGLLCHVRHHVWDHVCHRGPPEEEQTRLPELASYGLDVPDSFATHGHDRYFHPLCQVSDWPATTYAIYVIHMMVAVPMLVLEVPFAKWAHLAYRPLVLYLMKVKEVYLAEKQEVAAIG